MGYCCEEHRLRATQRSLVSDKATLLTGVKGKGGGLSVAGGR